MPQRRNTFFEMLSAGILGGMRASSDAHDALDAVAPSKGDARNLTATGQAVVTDRPMTDDEAARVRRFFTVGRYLGRWFGALVAGIVLFGFGFLVFTRVVIPAGANLDHPRISLCNAASWITMIGGGCTLIACLVVSPPILVYKFFAVGRDLRKRQVRQISGILIRHATPPEYRWVVGDRAFDIVNATVWAAFEDGEYITVECLPCTGDILVVSSTRGSVDFLALQGG